MVSLPPLIVVAGPTATGKTELGIRLGESLIAQGRPATVISADSRQVYRGLDIGTAKVTGADRQRVPHAGLDLVDPDERFAVSDFSTHVAGVLTDVAKADGVALLVGGTGLYLRAVARGLDLEALPDDPAVRARLEAEFEAEGLEPLAARLQATAPTLAATTHLANPRRVVRALEIHATTGTRPSELRAAHAFRAARHAARIHFLDPPREELEQRLASRTRLMFERGLVKETARLVDRGFRESAPMRSVGYRQALAVLDGEMTSEQAERETFLESRRYAKRQRTWFRREPGTRFVPPPYEAVWEEAGLSVPVPGRPR